MAGQRSTAPQRQVDVFGSVADLYDDVRPGYPPGIADAIAAYHGEPPISSVAEIGAGTGKGTAVLERLGASLTCLEPDPRMAVRLAGKFPGARIEATTFEHWSPPEGGVDVLACAMAWHWLDPATRNRRARAALTPGGTLAVFGHRYEYADAGQRAAVQAALRSVDPSARERPADWFFHDVVTAGEFTDVRRTVLQRDLPMHREQYLSLVRTFGPHLARPPEQQQRGLSLLGRLIDDFGGTVVLDLQTTLVLARRP